MSARYQSRRDLTSPVGARARLSRSVWTLTRFDGPRTKAGSRSMCHTRLSRRRPDVAVRQVVGEFVRRRSERDDERQVVEKLERRRAAVLLIWITPGKSPAAMRSYAHGRPRHAQILPRRVISDGTVQELQRRLGRRTFLEIPTTWVFPVTSGGTPTRSTPARSTSAAARSLCTIRCSSRSTYRSEPPGRRPRSAAHRGAPDKGRQR